MLISDDDEVFHSVIRSGGRAKVLFANSWWSLFNGLKTLITFCKGSFYLAAEMKPLFINFLYLK